MPKFIKTCPYCGDEFVTDSRKRKFCTKGCANRASANKIAVNKVISKKDRDLLEDYDQSFEWEKAVDGQWQCPYNMAVSCPTRRCSKCGWNPAVAEARKNAMEKTYGCNLTAADTVSHRNGIHIATAPAQTI